MTLKIILLAIIQGFAELLPVSSSAHVILAERLMGLDPSTPDMTFMLVMLHTGTMGAVLVYFWPRWRKLLTSKSAGQSRDFLKAVIVATGFTGVIGLSLKFLIERVILEDWLGHPHGEVEMLFKELPLIAAALASAGILILVAARYEKRATQSRMTTRSAIWIGIVQGVCLPFRGFSRSGATISTAMLNGVSRSLSEDFSFALAVVLTPPVILQQIHRLSQHWGGEAVKSPVSIFLLIPGVFGAVFSFAAGLVALRWLSAWLEKGRWAYFGYYCLFFSVIVLGAHFAGV